MTGEDRTATTGLLRDRRVAAAVVAVAAVALGRNVVVRPGPGGHAGEGAVAQLVSAVLGRPDPVVAAAGEAHARLNSALWGSGGQEAYGEACIRLGWIVAEARRPPSPTPSAGTGRPTSARRTT